MASFAKMHDTWIYALSVSGASGREWAVFSALTRYDRNKDGTYSRPVRDIARACGLTEKQVGDTIAALKKRCFPMGGESWALLDVVVLPAKGRTTTYRVNAPVEFSQWDFSSPVDATRGVRHAPDAVNATNGRRSKGRGNATSGSPPMLRVEAPQCYERDTYPIDVSIRGGDATSNVSIDGGCCPSQRQQRPPLERDSGVAPSADGAAHAQETDTTKEGRFIREFLGRYLQEMESDPEKARNMLCTFLATYPEYESQILSLIV